MLNDARLSPRSGGKPDSLVVILHGLGDSASGVIDLGSYWGQAMPGTLFAAPDAPFPCDMSPFGYQWFSAQDWSKDVVLQGIKRASAPLNEYLNALLTAFELPSQRLALVGFSQGTMMSLYIAPRRKEGFAGVLGYSGALVGGETLVTERQSRPPILLVHGDRDDVLPLHSMEIAEEGLKLANLNVRAIVRPGLGHSIDDVGLSEGLTFLRQVLA